MADIDGRSLLAYRHKARPSGDWDDAGGLRSPTAPEIAATSDVSAGPRASRPHAQGGLGAVFVCRTSTAELHREVALKQILAQHADNPVSRQRFLLEAEVTGGLEHPGIVPVYGLGTYQDGRPYYAMRFIRGDSLKDSIAAFHADRGLKDDPGRRSLEPALAKALLFASSLTSTAMRLRYARARSAPPRHQAVQRRRRQAR